MCSYNRVNGTYMCENPPFSPTCCAGSGGSRATCSRTSSPCTRRPRCSGRHGPRDARSRARSAHALVQRGAAPAALDTREITIANIDTALARRYRQMFRLGIFDRPVARRRSTWRAMPRSRARSASSRRCCSRTMARILPLDARVAAIGRADRSGRVRDEGGRRLLRRKLRRDPVRDGHAARRREAGARAGEVVRDGDAHRRRRRSRNLAEAVAAARAADVAIVLAGTIAEEGRDRTSIALANGQDSIITAVAAANPRTVVVLKDNASSLTPWIDAVPAVLETWFPGQEDGAIVARLLFGLATPSGKLPVTFPVREADLPASDREAVAGRRHAGQCRCRQRAPAVRRLGDADARGVLGGAADRLSLVRRERHRAALPVRLRALVHDVRADESRRVAARRVGDDADRRVGARHEHRASDAAPRCRRCISACQRDAGEPPKRLVAFRKVWLEPGKSTTVRMTIDPARRAIRSACGTRRSTRWVVRDGTYVVRWNVVGGDVPVGHVRVRAGR